MKMTKYTYFIFCCCLLGGSACNDNQYTSSNYQEQINQHNYDTSSDYAAKTEGDYNSNEQDESSARGHWQKPKVVLAKMGDMTGKVIADIGAGPYGYFTWQIANNTEVEKVIAIDVDQEAIQFIENQRAIDIPKVRDRVETRLAEPDDPKLLDNEADIVLIVNTYIYFDSPVEYFKHLRKGIAKDGKLVIIDFKKKITPGGPPLPIHFRTSVGKVEQDLLEAGYVNIESDDQSLDYQYIVIAQPGLED